MKRFSCPVCTEELHFEDVVCPACHTQVVYQPLDSVFLALPPQSGPNTIQGCANRDLIDCNWMVRPETGNYCLACSYTRTIPNLSVDKNIKLWREIDLAKRFLFYSILKWRLPRPHRNDDDPNGLAFDFLADITRPDGSVKRVLTGHANGLITVNIAEGDDAEREARRTSMGEPYRTLIGHMRHEIGHFYWDRLIRDGNRLDEFRAVFGDERASYRDALKAHYANGPKEGWEENYISSYAASHPWEDWAETWAHYIHIVDASETAHAFGMTIRPSRFKREEVEVDANPYYGTPFKELLSDWVPLTVAINCLNRSIGQPEMYPFVLTDAVEKKLSFIHDLIGGAN